MLEGEGGGHRPLGKGVLAELFRLRGAGVRMVVLNACHSIPQAEAIAEHVGCAIGMRRAIGSEAASEFAAALYRAIGSGRLRSKAFDAARLHLRRRRAFRTSDASALGEEIRPTSGASGAEIRRYSLAAPM